MEDRRAAMVRAAELADPGKQIPTLPQMAAMLDVALSHRGNDGFTESADGRQDYLTFSQLLKKFGYSRERMNSYLRRMKAENKVRIIRPTDENGKTGDCRYHVGDVEAAMLISPDIVKHSPLVQVGS